MNLFKVYSRDISRNDNSSTAWKCSNMEFFLVRIFPHLDWIRWDTLYLSIFSPNAGKCGPEKTLYLYTFHVVTYQVTKMITLSFGKFIHERLQLLVICKVKVSVSSTASSILSSFSLKRLTYEGLTSGNFLENPKLRRTFFSNFTGLICRNLEYLLQI